MATKPSWPLSHAWLAALGRRDLRLVWVLFVELHHRSDFGDRDQVVAAKPAAFPLDAALLVRAFNAGVAVERASKPWWDRNAIHRVDSVRSRPNSTRDTAALRLS